MGSVDTLILGGKLVDGTGNPWRWGDVAVDDGRILALGRDLGALDARQVIKAEGLVVAPGFVDAHSHADLTLLADQDMEYRVMQGITTEVVGQDGLSYAPASPDHLAQWRRYLKGLNGEFSDRIDWNWKTTGELLDRYRDKASNAVHLVPHGAVRVEVVGWEDRPATPEELDRMSALVRESLQQGAAGLSTGLTYIPCSHATTEEMVALCRPLGEVGGVLSIHLRSYGEHLLEAVKEAVTMGRDSGAAIHISHLRMADRSTWGLADRVLGIIERARDQGVDVTFDLYPYTVGCAPLFCLLPPWAQSKGPEVVVTRLKEADQREEIKAEMAAWDVEWSHYLLSNAPHPRFEEWEGHPLTVTAQALDLDVQELILDVLLGTDLDATIVASGGSEEDNRVMLAHPAGMIGSDGVMVGGHPHPRGFGTYPKLFQDYVRESGLLRLEEAVRKVTSLPAARHGILDRGQLAVGAPADVVVFSLEHIADQATYRNARRPPRGVQAVLVNGWAAVRDGRYRGSKAGQPLRPRIPFSGVKG